MLRSLTAALIVSLAAWSVPVRAQTASADALLRRMTQVNPGLETYTAATHVDIALHSFPFVSPGLDGNYYYKQPDKQAIVFNTVPVLAQQFQRLYPKVDPPATWPSLYDVSILAQDAGTTTLRLVPKRHGRIAHLDVRVDNANALPSSFSWSYEDGGSVSFRQEYANVYGNYLVKSQSGKVDFPSYKADVTSTFSNFKVNVPIPDSVFEG